MNNNVVIITSNPSVAPKPEFKDQIMNVGSEAHMNFAKEFHYCVGQLWNRISSAKSEYDVAAGAGELSFHMFTSAEAVNAADKNLWKTCRMVIFRSWNGGNGYGNIITRDSIAYLAAINAALTTAKNESAIIQVI